MSGKATFAMRWLQSFLFVFVLVERSTARKYKIHGSECSSCFSNVMIPLT